MEGIILTSDKNQADPALLYIKEDCIRVQSSKVLCIFISADLSWIPNTTDLIEKVQQQLLLLSMLKKTNLDRKLLVTLYCYILLYIIKIEI